MCGIIGFTGRLEAQKILTEGLAALEYRGDFYSQNRRKG